MLSFKGRPSMDHLGCPGKQTGIDKSGVPFEKK